MALSSTRSPFKDFFDAVVATGEPARNDIIREGFREGDVTTVRRQAREVVELRRAGQNAEARSLAREFATDWARRLDADNDWELDRVDDDPHTDDPAELAARVFRQGGNVR